MSNVSPNHPSVRAQRKRRAKRKLFAAALMGFYTVAVLAAVVGLAIGGFWTLQDTNPALANVVVAVVGPWLIISAFRITR